VPLTTEDVMEELGISRGNANMNLRELIDWGLLRRESKRGERKEFFVAEKDINEVAKRIARERRKRELEPLINALNALHKIDEANTADGKAFKATVSEIQKFAENIDGLLDKLIRADENWLLGFFTKLLKA
jgi:DNA-binding transcriptional regulator GbsR (MarR family)